MHTLGLILAAQAATSTVFIDVERAAQLIQSGAEVLDARGDDARAPYLPGAQVVDWTDLRDSWGRTGRLDTVKNLRGDFQALGISSARAVLVYGAFHEGWGEEGRIWWTLRYLGHARVFILDGGVTAWVKEGQPTMARPQKGKQDSKWQPRVQDSLRVDGHTVNRLRTRPEVRVLDTRTRDEYMGATPYWSSRGGHIPGAVHLHFRTLIGTNQRLLPVSVLRTRFRAAGLRPEHRILTYCTGGVRSAFVLAALMQAGFMNVANYDGSWWEWSGSDAFLVR